MMIMSVSYLFVNHTIPGLYLCVGWCVNILTTIPCDIMRKGNKQLKQTALALVICLFLFIRFITICVFGCAKRLCRQSRRYLLVTRIILWSVLRVICNNLGTFRDYIVWWSPQYLFGHHVRFPLDSTGKTKYIYDFKHIANLIRLIIWIVSVLTLLDKVWHKVLL